MHKITKESKGRAFEIVKNGSFCIFEFTENGFHVKSELQENCQNSQLVASKMTFYSWNQQHKVANLSIIWRKNQNHEIFSQNSIKLWKFHRQKKVSMNGKFQAAYRSYLPLWTGFSNSKHGWFLKVKFSLSKSIFVAIS